MKKFISLKDLATRIETVRRSLNDRGDHYCRIIIDDEDDVFLTTENFYVDDDGILVFKKTKTS